jgi:hypothetical protein
MIKRPWLGGFFAVAMLSPAGCGSTLVDGSSGGGAEGADDTGGGGAGGEAPAYFDLDSCGILLACESMNLHNSSVWPEDAPECAARLLASSERGLVRATLAPGPTASTFLRWIYVLGDGTAIVQTKDVECFQGPCIGPILGVHQRCDIRGHEEIVQRCAESDPDDPDDRSCSWSPFFEAFENCQEIAEQDCASVVAFAPEVGD